MTQATNPEQEAAGLIVQMSQQDKQSAWVTEYCHHLEAIRAKNRPYLEAQEREQEQLEEVVEEETAEEEAEKQAEREKDRADIVAAAMILQSMSRDQ